MGRLRTKCFSHLITSLSLLLRLTLLRTNPPGQRPNDGAAWVKMSSVPNPRNEIYHKVGAHLLNWEQVRYQVKACNPSGCSAFANAWR